MQPFREALERYDRLWREAERLVEAYLARHFQQTGSDSEKPSAADPPDLKELNALILILKRIQDGRRAIEHDAAKLAEVTPPDDEEGPDSLDDERISRILQLLQNDEEEEGDPAGEV